MKRVIRKLLEATTIAILAMMLASCNDPLGKNNSNPVEVKLTGKDFQVTLLDHEYGYSRDSVYCFEGIWKKDAFYFGHWKLDPMVPNILPDNRNRLEFHITSDATGFQGVNASSSARCINIVQDGSDHTRYHLEWVSEGESTITFWNGEGEARKEISFKATSKSHIPFVTLKYRYDGELYTALELTSQNYRTILKQCPQGNTEWDNMPIYEVVPEPLNATLDENTYIWGELTARLHRVTENGEEDSYTFETIEEMYLPGSLTEHNDRYKFRIRMTYEDIYHRWPETRLCDKPLKEGEEYTKLNFNDLRERKTVAYKVVHKKYKDDSASKEKQYVGGTLRLIQQNPTNPNDWKDLRILNGLID